jgi:hypothetical protein
LLSTLSLYHHKHALFLSPPKQGVKQPFSTRLFVFYRSFASSMVARAECVERKKVVALLKDPRARVCAV